MSACNNQSASTTVVNYVLNVICIRYHFYFMKFVTLQFLVESRGVYY